MKELAPKAWPSGKRYGELILALFVLIRVLLRCSCSSHIKFSCTKWIQIDVTPHLDSVDTVPTHVENCEKCDGSKI